MNKRIGTPFYACFDPFVIIYRRFAEDDELYQISIASSLGQTSDAAFSRDRFSESSVLRIYTVPLFVFQTEHLALSHNQSIVDALHIHKLGVGADLGKGSFIENCDSVTISES